MSKCKLSRLDLITAFLLFCAVLLASLLYLDSGHEWGDDHAAYINTAIAIANGSLEKNDELNVLMHPSALSFLPEEETSLHYVWGYPLLLVPIYLLFGFDTELYSTVIYYKLPGALSLALLSVVLFFLYRRHFRYYASLFLAVIVSFSAGIFTAVNTIYTDLPCLLFAMLSILMLDVLLDCRKTSSRLFSGILLGISMWAVYVIRLNGISVVLAVCFGHLLWLLLNRKSIRAVHLPLHLLPYVLLGVMLYVSYQVLPVPTSNTSDLGQLTYGVFLYNIDYYYEMLGKWSNSLFGGMNDGLLHYSGLVILLPVLAIAGTLRQWKRVLHIALLTAGTLFAVLLLNYRQELRYLYFALPLLMLLAGYGAKWVWSGIEPHLDSALQKLFHFAGYALPLMIGAMVVLNTYSASIEKFVARGEDKHATDSYSTFAVDVYRFIQENTPEDAVIAFYKPRSLYLNTGRVSFKLQADKSYLADYEHFWPYQERYVDVDLADYFLLYSSTSSQLKVVKTELGEHADDLELVYSNSQFKLYKRIR